MNFVTQNRTRLRGENKRGRPRKYSDAAARQKAYRQRKGAAVPLDDGTRVRHQKYGAGIIYHLLSDDRALVAFVSPDRTWRDLPLSELTALGIAKKIPTWADPEISNTKKRREQLSRFPSEKSLVYASFPGVNIKDIPVFTRNVAGKGRRFKDFTKAVNNRIAGLIWQAKGKTL